MSQPLVQVLVIAALALALLGLLLGIATALRQRRVLQRYRVLAGDGKADVATVLARQDERIARQQRRVEALQTDLAAARADTEQSLRHVAVVRYDAFGDMGGRMSFSVALVDDRGDGVVLSSIHARGESRTYAKGVVGGASDVTLTPEEQQALAAARSDHG